MTKELHKLPTSWAWSCVGEIASVKGGKRLPKGHNYSEVKTDLPYIRVTDFINMTINRADLKFLDIITQEKIKNYIIRKDDVYISIAGSIGKVGTIPDDLDGANLTENAAKITDIRCYNHKALSYVLESPFSQEQIAKLKTHTNQPKLALFRIETINLPVPPLYEQKRIVEKIDELLTKLNAGVESLKKVQILLKKYRQSVLKSAVEGKLTSEWRKQHNDELEPGDKLLERILKERKEKWEAEQLAYFKSKGIKPPKEWKDKYKEPSPPDTSNLPELPDAWVWATWDQISNWVTYGFTRPMPHVDDGIPIVTAKNVKNSKIDIINTHKTTIKSFAELSPKDFPQVKDILITKDGTIGRSSIVGEEHGKFCINQSVAVIWLRSCPIIREYLLAVIESPITQKPILTKARGVAIKHLSITDFAKLPLPIPPLKEQKALIEKLSQILSVIENLENSTDDNFKRINSLRLSILKYAFEGKLVPQDPNDEPASVLLERIKTEKQKTKKLT